MSNNPFTGAGYVLQGLQLIFSPGLKRYLIVPVTINILVFSLVGWLGERSSLLADQYKKGQSCPCICPL